MSDLMTSDWNIWLKNYWKLETYNRVLSFLQFFYYFNKNHELTLRKSKKYDLNYQLFMGTCFNFHPFKTFFLNLKKMKMVKNIVEVKVFEKWCK